MNTMSTEFMKQVKEEFVQAMLGAINELRADAEGYEAKAAECREKADEKEQEVKHFIGFVSQIDGFIEYVENLESTLEKSKEAAKDDTKEILSFLSERGVSATLIEEAKQLAGIESEAEEEAQQAATG